MSQLYTTAVHAIAITSALQLLYARLSSLYICYCNGFNHICYHILSTTAVHMVAIAGNLI